MTQRNPAASVAPHYLQGARRYPRVAAQLSDQWQRACEIATALGDTEETIRYALVKLHANGAAERQRMPGTGGRVVYAYRRAS
jgi:predicted transcriptional regulator